MILKDDRIGRGLGNLQSLFRTSIGKVGRKLGDSGIVVSWLLLLLKWWEDLLFIGHKQGTGKLSVRKISYAHHLLQCHKDTK